jgi:hypothetical protein
MYNALIYKNLSLFERVSFDVNLAVGQGFAQTCDKPQSKQIVLRVVHRPAYGLGAD